MSHHAALLAAYASALVGWGVAARLLPALWPRPALPVFARPRSEVAFALLACAAVLLIGQAYVRGWLLPHGSGGAGVVIDACNQVIIFAPLFVLLFVRRQSVATAWLPLDRVWLRVGVGVVLALAAILVFSLARAGSDPWITVVTAVYQPANLSHLTQVFCEDVAIAILFVRFRAVLGTRLTVGLVAGLFALGHLPSLLAAGATMADCAMLVLDVGLGVVILSVLHRSADIWWFWGVHFAMDMMQYHAVPASVVGTTG